MKKPFWLIQAAFFYLFTLFVATLPRSQSVRIGKRIGAFLYNILHSRRAIAIDNISQALPFMKRHPSWTGDFDSAEEIALATFRNLGISIVEVCRLYHGKGNYLIDTAVVDGLENFRNARKRKTACSASAAIAATGNWFHFPSNIT